MASRLSLATARRTHISNLSIKAQKHLFSTSSIRHANVQQPPDVLIVGSGAAALTAALRAKSHNLNPLVIEKTSFIGGTTAYSGGGLWIPNSGVHSRAVHKNDSFEQALTYMNNVIDNGLRASTPERRTAFLRNGPKMVQFLKGLGFEWRPSVGYPDYYPMVEGGKVGGRSIEGAVFDLKRLGDWRSKIRMADNRPTFPMHTHEGTDLMQHRVSLKGLMKAVEVMGWRLPRHKMMGREPATMGTSLVGQLMLLCKNQGIDIQTDTGLKELVLRDGKVVGAVVESGREEKVIEAKRGVVLAAGGFSRNTDLRKKYQSPSAAASKTLTSPEDKGDAISAGMKIGAATELMDEAWWGPCIVDASGTPNWAQYERALPHSIIVDSAGNRLVNEAESYTRLIRNVFAHQKKTGRGIPAFFILDSNHRKRYVLSGMMPGKSIDQKALDSGLYVMANSLEELGQRMGIDVEGLKATVTRFNKMAAAGVDEDFQRGLSPYDNFFGDTKYTPNPNLGPVAEPPYYGARYVPGDLGTKGGVLTDENARALKEDGAVIPGLYAVGNSSASVIGRDYIGAGSTLGPALTFAFIAANDLGSSGA